MLKTLMTVASLALVPVSALAESQITGDAEKGERVFKKCKACHMVGEDAEHKVGPILNGIVDRAIASADGFTYSKVLTQMGADGVVWGSEELAAFLEKPRKYAKGTKMSFAGLRKEKERADIIAYLASFPDGGS